MAETNHSPTPEDLRAGYELSDLDPKKIGIFGIVLLLTLILVAIVTYLMSDWFYALERRNQPPQSPLSFAPEPVPDPRLIVDPGGDLSSLRASEKALLNNYGWVDKEKGIARIPIDDAISILADKGLPVRSENQPAAKTGGPAPTPRATSGRQRPATADREGTAERRQGVEQRKPGARKP